MKDYKAAGIVGLIFAFFISTASVVASNPLPMGNEAAVWFFTLIYSIIFALIIYYITMYMYIVLLRKDIMMTSLWGSKKIPLPLIDISIIVSTLSYGFSLMMLNEYYKDCMVGLGTYFLAGMTCNDFYNIMLFQYIPVHIVFFSLLLYTSLVIYSIVSRKRISERMRIEVERSNGRG